MSLDRKKFNFINLDSLISSGFINKSKHPEFPVYVLNYTRKAQFEQNWCLEVMLCRGLVIDENNRFVNSVLPKFFDYSQLCSHKSHLWASTILRKIGTESFECYDKLDGSFIAVSFFNGDMVVNSRGSFISEHALKAKIILNAKYSKFKWNKNYTYIFELIAPEFRIVLDYGTVEDLILLAIIESQSCREVAIHDIDTPFKKSEKFNISSFEELCALQPENKEGFVIKFADNSRVKIKTDDYKLKHKIITNTNERTIWEYLSTNQPLDDLIAITDDIFDDFIRKAVSDLEGKFSQIAEQAVSEYDEILTKMPDNLERREGRKAFAEMAKNTSYPSLMFTLLDNRPMDKLIWKMIEPSFPKKAFNYIEEE